MRGFRLAAVSLAIRASEPLPPTPPPRGPDMVKGSYYKMSKVKNYFLDNIYFIYRYSKMKK